ncbi:toprim domain-containing protein [Deinococcus sp. DB0503]|uniref:toprim domain-containing protein n=1 Tax=Deinococcus sp. DB0503 TaxID=2479203 RepID=UPI0018DF54DF|nr:toprim domain-containing protein [Deinococcus sp. DB0503]MBI0447202.1 hypothetical protein [Deinococcus sp. DB0503]
MRATGSISTPPGRDDTLDRAVDAAHLPDILNTLCPTPETQRLSENGGVICDPRPGRSENNPSFSVKKQKGRWLWHRFGAPGVNGRDEGGNAYHLLLSLGMSPREAARWLIDFTGVLPGTSAAPRPRLVPTRRDPLDELRDEMARWRPVEKGLTPKHGPACEARGFAPDDTEHLHLADLGGDLAFEIRNPAGQLLAMKARRKADAGGRYYFLTPDHGSPPWCSPAKAETPILLVEGELNGMSAHLARPDLQVIALAGTNGKFDPAWVEGRDVYVYADADPDGKGEAAARRWANVVQLAGGRASVLPALEWPRDFNDVLREEGRGALRLLLDQLIGSAPTPEPDRRFPSHVAVFEEGGAYWVPGRGKDSPPVQVTNWLFEAHARLTYPDGRRGTRGTAYTQDGRAVSLDIPADAWNSRAELLAEIGRYDLLILASSNAEVARLRAHLLHQEQEANLPSIVGVETYGEHVIEGQRLAVYHDAVLSAAGELETPPVFYAGPEGLAPDLHAAPPSSRPQEAQEAVSALKASLGLINPHAALAIACKAAAAHLAPRTTRLWGNRNPMVTITGERESGKSSYAELWLRATTGRTARTVKAHDLRSDFQYDSWLSGQNDLIAILDEYHPDHLDDTLLKGHYDLAVKRRGTGVGAHATSYHRNSPLIILGQHDVTDPATRSRSVQYATLPSERGTSDAYYAAWNAPLEAVARPLRQAALGVSDELLAAWVAEGRQMAQAALSSREPRLEVALADLVVGARLLNHALAFGITDDQLRDLLAAGVKNTLEGAEGGQGQKSSVEVFLEQLGFALKLRPANLWGDFLAIPDGDRSGSSVILRTTACAELVKAQYRDKAAVLSGVMLGKLVSQLEWFTTSAGGVFKSGGRAVRGVTLHFDAAPARVDLDALQDIALALINGTEDADAG